MKTTSVVAGAVALAFSLGSAQATELVTNGDFTQLSNGVGQLENQTVATDWSANGGYNFVFTSGTTGGPGQYGGLQLWTAANGGNNSWNGLNASNTGNFAALDGDFNTAPLSQTITGLTSGKTYYLTFNYAFGQQFGFSQSTVQSLTTSVGGSQVWTSGLTNVDNHGFTGWQSADVAFKATGSSEVLSFLAYGNKPVPPFALVSNVSIDSVPELSTWAMMLAGFAGLAFAGYRRSKSRAAA